MLVYGVLRRPSPRARCGSSRDASRGPKLKYGKQLSSRMIGRNMGRPTYVTRFLFAFAACFVLWAFPFENAWAGYPDRIITIVVPFAPGGGTDVIARTLAQEMAKELGQSVIIENKAGAGT